MSKIPQHPPLRTPSGWNAQESALIIQLEQILTDIYRMIGNLNAKAEDLDKRVAELEEE